ncbi:MAG: hypothetical protein KatS3mg105_2407 [Gemmatales bacterium]|nr:MAG: hypothetical protein KatS3mg105_2407 [Gemmatales bacterium]
MIGTLRTFPGAYPLLPDFQIDTVSIPFKLKGVPEFLISIMNPIDTSG